MIKNFKKNKTSGFTLLEVIVSVAIFSIVFVSVAGAFVSVMDAYQKVTSTSANIDNLTSALESMVRETKTGSVYFCSNSPGTFTTPHDCSSGGNYFAFTNINVPRPYGSVNDPIVYKFVSCSGAPSDPYCGRIQRSDDSGASYYPVTVAPPAITINYVKFYVTGTAPLPDIAQPKVTIIMKGTVGVKANIVVPFSVQTTVSQRILDLN